jgi:tRNA(Leu) C34 or U34 (ribose-2'-O)-methylase TrmL
LPQTFSAEDLYHGHTCGLTRCPDAEVKEYRPQRLLAIDSLNVATATAVVLYEAMRQRKKK